jgi:hypothetical protein
LASEGLTVARIEWNIFDAPNAILMQLARRRARTCFTDAVAESWVSDGYGTEIPARGKIATLLNKHLGINALKHMDGQGDEFVELDLEFSVKSALVLALENFRLWAREPFPGAEEFMQQLTDEGFFK